jgi:hypothetical protein
MLSHRRGVSEALLLPGSVKEVITNNRSRALAGLQRAPPGEETRRGPPLAAPPPASAIYTRQS